MDRIKEYNLCTKRDSFVEDKCIWIADLSNGMKVFQDDNRQHVQPTSAWERLKIFLSENQNIKIDCFRFRYGTHIIKPADSALVYFYSKGIMKDLQGPKSVDFHVFGSSNNLDTIECVSYSAPGLEIIKKQVRNISDCDKRTLIIQK